MKSTTSKGKPTATKSELAAAYGVHYNTFMKRIKEIKELNLSPSQRILMPKQIQLIYEALGEPKME